MLDMFLICFTENRIARIIVTNTKMSVDTIIKDDNRIVSRAQPLRHLVESLGAT